MLPGLREAAAASARENGEMRGFRPPATWALLAALGLGALAVAETLTRGDHGGSSGNIGNAGNTAVVLLLLSLGATLPLAFVRASVVAPAIVITGAALLPLVFDSRPTVAAILSLAVVACLTLAAGVRHVRRQASERAGSRQALANTLLDYAARGERTRIARELHDVVAHHISMISVQAEAARLTTPGMPVQGADRLAEISATARTALTEMRRLLGVLREGGETQPSREPQPGLPELVRLIDEARQAAAASVRLIVSGSVRPLDAGVELTVYRILQEALTNARRHAPGAPVDIELCYSDHSLDLRVRDGGPGTTGEPAAGHGLLGMRERAAMMGGSFTAGADPVHGFLVTATLPIKEAS